MNSQRALIKQISKDQIQIKTKASMQFKRLRGRRYCVDCKSQAFMEGIFSQPNPSKSQETITFFTCDGMVQLHSQGVLDIERCRKLQEKYDQLPTADEQWPDFGCEGIKVQRAHQPTSQCQGKKKKKKIGRAHV
eukprot:TRINITY_DN1183_c0_g1_i5.p2 TRINITY_DN1183_c0_g1~~TRINITY_DN1183_c0_g1_i5.p2  ORF type:complete len:134 (+),score=12.45 TRINITY_DN1183_c0_g1_i5:66-467(+)